MDLGKLVRRLFLAAVVCAVVSPKKAEAAVLHANPQAYTIVDKNFNDGNVDDWVPDVTYPNIAYTADMGYLRVNSSSTGAIFLNNLVLPEINEIQCKISTYAFDEPNTSPFGHKPELQDFAILDYTPDPLEYTGALLHAGGFDGILSSTKQISLLQLSFGTGTQLDGETFNDVPLSGNLWDEFSLVKDYDSVELYINGNMIGSVPANRESSNGTLSLWIPFGSHGFLYVDDLKVWTIPEPVSLLPLTLGALALARRPRKYVQSQIVDSR